MKEHYVVKLERMDEVLNQEASKIAYEIIESSETYNDAIEKVRMADIGTDLFGIVCYKISEIALAQAT